MDLLIEGDCQPVQVHTVVLIDLKSVLQHPPSGEFFIGPHWATKAVVVVLRRRRKLDGEILMTVDKTCEGEVSGGGFGHWNGP